MNALRKLQQDFTAYLTGNGAAIIDNVVDQGNVDRKTRLDIYQNAYRVRLRNCIETDHPMLGLYLGDELFEQMVEGYISQYPSHYPSLRQFGEQLPEYLATNTPFREHPILAEIATFERMLMFAFDAADGDPLSVDNLQSLPAEQWPSMTLDFHPGVQVLETRWNSVESWQALKNNEAPPPASEQAAWWILWRDPNRLTQYRNLGLDGFILYQCFRDDYSFAEACELLKEHLPENDIGPACVNHLQAWFDLGLITGLQNR